MIEISFMEDSVNMNYDLFVHLLEKEKQGAPTKHLLLENVTNDQHTIMKYHPRWRCSTAPLVKITERC